MTGSAGPERPVELVMGDAAGGDLDQHVAEHGGGLGHLLEDEPVDAGWLGKRMAFIACPLPCAVAA